MAHKDEIRTQGHAAKYCHCPVSIISRWVKRGWLKKNKEGYFYREDLDECRAREYRLAEKFFGPQGHGVIENQKEAARYAGVSPRTIRRWRDEGGMRVIKKIFYIKAELDRFKNQGTKQKPA